MWGREADHCGKEKTKTSEASRGAGERTRLLLLSLPPLGTSLSRLIDGERGRGVLSARPLMLPSASPHPSSVRRVCMDARVRLESKRRLRSKAIKCPQSSRPHFLRSLPKSKKKLQSEPLEIMFPFGFKFWPTPQLPTSSLSLLSTLVSPEQPLNCWQYSDGGGKTHFP